MLFLLHYIQEFIKAEIGERGESLVNKGTIKSCPETSFKRLENVSDGSKEGRVSVMTEDELSSHFAIDLHFLTVENSKDGRISRDSRE